MTAGSVALVGCSALDRGRGPNEAPPASVGSDWTSAADAWRYPAADVHNTRRSTLPVSAEPTVAWTAPRATDSARRSLLAATATRAVVATDHDGWTVLRSRDPANGTVRWRRTFDGRVRSGGLVAGVVVVSVAGTDVLALDAADGTVRWRVDLFERVAEAVPKKYLTEFPEQAPEEFAATPLATPDEVYVQTAYGVHGLAPDDGTERWRLYLGDQTAYADQFQYPTGLALAPDRLWACYGHPEATLVTVFDAGGEVTVQATETAGNATRPVVVGDGPTYSVGLSYHASGSTNFAGPLVTGVDNGPFPDWTFPGLATHEGPTRFSRVATDGEWLFVPQARIVDGETEFAVMALRHATGGLGWVARERLGRLGDPADLFQQLELCRPVVAGETLLVGYATITDPEPDEAPTSGVLVGRSTRDGTERWRVPLDLAPARLAVADDRVFVAGWQGGLAALAR